ncbi:MAG TPA: FxLD family lanthipeptide [Pseudonocardiaceae bacterium]|nr:FxLD family lanthipeptide [Pseudonocardiaceae bacterium]
MPMPTQTPAASSTEFDLDVSIVASGPVVADLMRNTDDNCGSTCQSACSNSTC